mmetsp:Transcript_10817/g.23276  ORF Transcript_10817/g.23276 Transcript_10817/m.23276 type:complete len:115 (-) Transcript_10817:1210-1554(-)
MTRSTVESRAVKHSKLHEAVGTATLGSLNALVVPPRNHTTCLFAWPQMITGHPALTSCTSTPPPWGIHRCRLHRTISVAYCQAPLPGFATTILTSLAAAPPLFTALHDYPPGPH